MKTKHVKLLRKIILSPGYDGRRYRMYTRRGDMYNTIFNLFGTYSVVFKQLRCYRKAGWYRNRLVDKQK